ncbi:TonB-dependent receptor plug domain-containing protein [Haliea sp.]
MSDFRRFMLAGSLLGNLSVIPDSVSADLAEEQRGTAIEEVLVTGTRIQRANLGSPSPVVEVSARELSHGGSDRLEDLLKALPQLYTDQNRNTANGSTGTATLDLRNLGPQRTLILMDGRRLPGGSPLAAGVADINQIPASLIERVEVLSGGASATYGSDAVAGVVNFLLMDDFEGVGLEAQFSQYRHRNDDDGLEQLLAASGFDLPEGSVSDGDSQQIALRVGHNFAEDAGNITAYATWRESDAVIQAGRIHSACALQQMGASRRCVGSSTIGEGRFTDFGLLAADFGLPPIDVMVQGDSFLPYDGRSYNFASLNHFQRPDRRWTAGLLGHYEFSPRARVFTQLMAMDNDTTAQIAPSAAFFLDSAIRCDNVLLSAQQRSVICDSYGLEGDDRPLLFVARRNVEGGPRRRSIAHQSRRAMLGLEGELGQKWQYEVYGQFAEVTLRDSTANELLVSRMRRALDVTRDPAGGEAVCAAALNGSDPDCVPWNIFTEGAVTPESIAYLSSPLSARGRTSQAVVSAWIGGQPALPLLQSPLATAGPALVFGGEYREETLRYDPDQLYRSGDAAGTGLPVPVLDGRFDIAEAYAELHAPLVENRPGIELLTLDLGYRHARYSTGASSNSFKLASIWALNPTLRLRGSLQEATRIANIEELFSPEGTRVFTANTGDPCAGPSPARSLADCARSGVSAGQYGSIPQSPNNNLRSLVGGNPALQPEDATTRTLGLIYTPGWTEGLLLSVDAYDIEIERAVTEPDPASTLQGCLDTGLAALCRQVQRDPERGDLWRPTGTGLVDARKQNAGYLRTRGVDMVLQFGRELGAAGHLRVHNLLTRVLSWELQNAPGGIVMECRGRWGGSCNSVVPKLRNYLRLTWETPWQLEISGLWRHIGGLSPVTGVGPEVSAHNYLDLSLRWAVRESLTLQAGINNLLDKDPPLVPANPPAGNGNTLPGVYDALGQYWFLGASVRF